MGFSPVTVDQMLLPSGNPFKYHEEVLYRQPMIPPKRFDILPLARGSSEGLSAVRFFFKQQQYSATYEWSHTHIYQAKDQPGKVANTARGQRADQ